MMTTSAAAMALVNVAVLRLAGPLARARWWLLVLLPSIETIDAVAKKLTDPPIKDAVKQAAAWRASDGDKPMACGHCRHIKKDSMHPRIEPMAAKQKGSAKRRTTLRIDDDKSIDMSVELSLPVAVDDADAVVLDNDKSNRASDMGTMVDQHVS
jgi:hypothetical protein